MPEKDPNNYSLITYAWVILIASWGGVVNYITRVKQSKVAKFSIVTLIGELLISGFAGVLTFWICQSFELDQLLTAACVGIAGHAGGRTIIMLEYVFNKKIENISKL